MALLAYELSPVSLLWFFRVLGKSVAQASVNIHPLCAKYLAEYHRFLVSTLSIRVMALPPPLSHAGVEKTVLELLRAFKVLSWQSQDSSSGPLSSGWGLPLCVAPSPLHGSIQTTPGQQLASGLCLVRVKTFGAEVPTVLEKRGRMLEHSQSLEDTKVSRCRLRASSATAERSA